MTIAFIFPGQGSQALGMGHALANAFPSAKHVFEEVDDALGLKLTDIMWGEDGDALNLTENTQAALMAVSVAVTRTLCEQGGFDLADKGVFVAGHSLGEYSALTAVNSIALSDTAKLLRLRGQAMQRAVPVGEGAMAAILGLSFDESEAVAHEAADNMVCEAANDNADGQVVLSGHVQAVEKACQIASEKGAKRAVMLPVSAPFHCSLMQPAADEMAAALSGTDFTAPSIPVVANVTAQAESNPDQLRDLLVQQITGRVRWRESVQWMADSGVTTMVELGSGKVLSGLVRRINKEITCMNVEKPEDLDSVIASLA